ncbi:MAG: toxin co-regulated pilus biosynthesis Q family protein [Rhodobacteraceae bacterium]|nr:toxin co-regulated pilus biosynthesis Q family protein [Paracoccaceae bacterium]
MHPIVPHRPPPAVPRRPRRAARAGLALTTLLAALAAAPAAADGPGLPGVSPYGVRAPSAAGAWAVLSGGDLRGTLEAWAEGAGWTVVWDSPLNYRLRASARYGGGFEQAVAGLIDAIHLSNPELRVTMYRGNRVLHVENALVETR